MKHTLLPLKLVLFFLLTSIFAFGQTPLGCDTNAVRAAFAAAGHYTELIVDGEPCSMYFINTTSEDATQAEADAETLGAHLAVIKDATENANISAAINAAGLLGGGAVIWLGYHRTGTGDSYPFAPLDGTPLGYTSWTPGEPNDDGWGGGINSPGCYNSLTGCAFCSNQYNCQNGEQCVEMYASGTWNDLACNATSISLVKVNLCPVVNGIDDTLLCAAGATLKLTPTTLLGSVPYTYSWAPGGQNTASITVNPAATTTYTVMATDRYSCYSTTAITATVVNLTTPVITANPASACVGANTFINYTNTYPAGTVFNWTYDGGVNASGGAPDSISWATSCTKNVTLYVTDQGCTSGTGTLPVTVNTIPVATAGPAVQVCSSAQVTLGTTAVAGVSYSCSPAIGLSNAAISDPVFSAVNPGTTTLSYPFVVTATSNGCSSSSSAVVTLYPPISNTFTVTPSTVCSGQNAVITYTGTNSAAATYTWSFGTGANVVSGTAQGPYTVNWTTAGSPSVSLSVNENNCTITPVSTTVTVNAIPVADAGPAVQFCSGSSANLGLAPVAGVTYSWTPTLGLSSATASNPVIEGVNPTSANIVQTYTLIASENGCSDTATTVVTMYEPIVTTFTITPDSACINQNVTVTYTGTNDAGATYNWSFAGGTSTGTGQGPYSANWAIAGNYNVTLNVTENGCTGTATTVPVNVGNPPAANPQTETVCSGGTVPLGTAPVGTVAYSWSPASNLSSSTIAQPSFSYSNTATTAQTFAYTLLADDNGCTASATVNVTVSPPAAVPVVASGPLEFCDGDSVTLSFGAQYVAYQWTNTSTSAEITVSTVGSYGAALIDANGCEYISVPLAVVIVDANPTINVVQKTDEQCYGEADASITITGAGGHQPYSYSWKTTPAQTTAALSNILPGTYTVTVTDQKACTVTGQYVIDTAAYFGVPIDSGHNVSCYGFSDGEVFTTAKGGTPAYTYLWSNGEGTATIENLVAGTYKITVTDSHGCTVTDSTIITQPDSFSVAIGDSLSMNFGSQLPLSLVVVPSASYTYSWTPANSLTCADCPNPVCLASQSTVYNVVVTSPIGCSNTITFTVEVNGGKHLFVPNAFTPGSGNENDVFKVYTVGAQYFHIQIFDRWGEKVYEGNDLEDGWDGEYKGKPAYTGIYTYVMTVVYLDGQNLKRTGTLTLLR